MKYSKDYKTLLKTLFPNDNKLLELAEANSSELLKILVCRKKACGSAIEKIKRESRFVQTAIDFAMEEKRR